MEKKKILDSEVESSIKRMKLVESTNDGFKLAEEDLLIRGPGEIFGEKQTGNQMFKMADIVVDSDILEEANNCANEMIDTKALFEDEEYKSLYDMAEANDQAQKEIIEYEVIMEDTRIKIAVDAMGGDYAPKEIVEGVNLAIKNNPDLELVLFGDEKAIKEYLVPNDKQNCNYLVNH